MDLKKKKSIIALGGFSSSEKKFFNGSHNCSILSIAGKSDNHLLLKFDYIVLYVTSEDSQKSLSFSFLAGCIVRADVRADMRMDERVDD